MDSLLPKDFKPRNPDLNLEAIQCIPVTKKMYCSKCEERGWNPRVWPDDCPVCYGGDTYGGIYCAECEYCCGC